MSSSRGFSVRIFVPSGEPEGLRLVEKSNWTGQGLVFPLEKPRATSGKLRELVLRSKGNEARGFEGGEGFVVRAGSSAAAQEAPSIPSYLSAIRRALLGNGVLVDAGETYRLTQDYTFDSPSSASGVMLGRSSNGRVEWKDAGGRSLKEIQDAGSEGP